MLNSDCNNDKKPKTLKNAASWTRTHIEVKGYVDLKSTVLSTRIRSSMQLIDKNICYMQQIVNRGKRSAVSVNNGVFLNVAALTGFHCAQPFIIIRPSYR